MKAYPGTFIIGIVVTNEKGCGMDFSKVSILSGKIRQFGDTFGMLFFEGNELGKVFIDLKTKKN